jgi:hypothetical protein
MAIWHNKRDMSASCPRGAQDVWIVTLNLIRRIADFGLKKASEAIGQRLKELLPLVSESVSAAAGLIAALNLGVNYLNEVKHWNMGSFGVLLRLKMGAKLCSFCTVLGAGMHVSC